MPITEPGWKRLRIIAGEMDLLITCGIWTKAEYLRLLEDARVASPDFPQALEFLVNKADPSWLSERGG